MGFLEFYRAIQKAVENFTQINGYLEKNIILLAELNKIGKKQ
ncbi:hypothetical protein [Legionella clemsonensis]|uniref:Uncharacterized protein n=1 Tax=Legionella clemsonensis TaxID=1867846 RepID=A0A222NZW6_9GAMM|nr:hypothetical protein [Legionella clemsonensis]ASQ45116.1 hypothetical protein clem_02775 [Legionella clemsonensis]